ncbi:hypothetical protein WOLCODRAFT_148934 [Wolfiporia cocos MD-104 SS10]|uniref:Uncharacterized protein n=1 Tax=Wolfiporia cocos (strain MD-104) TaxID=742152 RepID=A0A2H3JDU0_WOLCO|nr:hypothetical protein WOLCODRAFT_148934 [Wolfiporia cocos MD-104 SS10]
MPPKKAPDNRSRQVTDILHNLRGEHFRHERNIQRAKPRVPSSSFNKPTLPFDQIYVHRPAQDERPSPVPQRTPVRLGPQGVLEYDYPRGPTPGPQSPRSWTASSQKGKEREVDVVAWRAEALSFVLSQLPPSAASFTDAEYAPVPPLTLLCLQVLLSFYSDSDSSDAFSEELVPYLPSHLRRDLLHWTAVHSPLSTSKLLALCEPDGHVEGELIVVGPQSSLPRDYFRKDRDNPAAEDLLDVEADNADRGEANAGHSDWSWDSPDTDEYTPPPFTSLILLACAVPITTLLAFPPTLTKVSLLALPAATPVHRLPRICPLIEVLDLSFNPWLTKDSGSAGETILQRIDWSRWSHLRMLPGITNKYINFGKLTM